MHQYHILQCTSLRSSQCTTCAHFCKKWCIVGYSMHCGIHEIGLYIRDMWWYLNNLTSNMTSEFSPRLRNFFKTLFIHIHIVRQFLWRNFTNHLNNNHYLCHANIANKSRSRYIRAKSNQFSINLRLFVDTFVYIFLERLIISYSIQSSNRRKRHHPMLKLNLV